MNHRFPEFDELRALLDALCEETITPDQVRRLEELLLARPEAEAFYVQYMSFFADLDRHFSVLPLSTTGPLRALVEGKTAPNAEERPASQQAPPQPHVHRGRSRFVWIAVGLGGLAAAALLAAVLWPYAKGPAPASDQAAERIDNTVAVLLVAPGAVWGDTEVPTRAGAPLPPGWLRLKAGLAHLEFYNGATVIVEGPADLRLISRSEAFCERGKLRATVPPQASGFVIGTPKLNLVDRGTEFGLRVGDDVPTEVHVFQGQVDVYDPRDGRGEAAKKEVTTGRGVRLDGPGRLSAIAPNPSAFKTAQESAQRSEDEMRQRQEAWRKASAELRRDPSLKLYYSFQSRKPGGRSLLDEAGERKQPCDGVIVGCTWATGRWPGRSGLEFKQVSDRVRLHIPGEFDELTMAAWVRVDALPHRFNSLFMTDGWDPGAPHWHISNEGRIELGVQARNPKGGIHFLSPPVFTPERLGRWVHLAVVYDRRGQVCHYVDGRPIHQEPVEFDTALNFGNAEMGNWNLGTRRDKSSIRYFNGCIDEFLLFSRSLTEQEIESLYEVSRPPF
jgi:hypothetical protein